VDVGRTRRVCWLVADPTAPPRSHVDASELAVEEPSPFHTVRLLSNVRLRCFVPLMAYNGLSLGFLFATFTGGLVTPVMSAPVTLLVMSAYFLTCSIGAQARARCASSHEQSKSLCQQILCAWTCFH
jgi:hypothetical protein